MSTEQELLAQIEELRKKAKDIEEQNKDTEFNKQRNFLINKVRDFLEVQVDDAELLAVLYKYSPSHSSQNHSPHSKIGYYLKKEDENMLFERKVINRYARYHEIRYEDSVEIINNFLGKIKPIINYFEFQQQQQKKIYELPQEQQALHQRFRKPGKGQENYNINLTQYVPEKYIPLFC